MKTGSKIMLVAAMAVMVGCLALVACQPEPEPEPINIDNPYGYEITDTIIVLFGDQRWTTLEYTSRIEHEELSGYDWIHIDAHKEGSTYPAFRMKILRGEGIHEGHMSINDPGLGFTVPGAITGDPQCGTVLYYEDGQVSSPDGTKTSDWWPLDIRMEVLKYVDSTKQVSAYVTGTLFDYESWVKRDAVNVEDAEVREFTITFGELPVGNH